MGPEVNCTLLIAYLEGWNELPLPEYAHDVSLVNLEKRIMALECAAGIASSPSTESSTLEGLVWRLWHVRFKQGVTPAGEFSHEYTQHNGMIDECDISLQRLRRVVDGLDPSLPVLQCSACKDDSHGSPSHGGSEHSSVAADSDEEDEDNECLGAIVQKLVYMAGRAWMFSPSATWTKTLALAYAAEMSFFKANRRLRGYPYPTPIVYPLSGREPPYAGLPREPPYARTPPRYAGFGPEPPYAGLPRENPFGRSPPRFPGFRPEPLGGRLGARIPKERAMNSVARSGRFPGFCSRGRWLSKILFWRSKKDTIDGESSTCSFFDDLRQDERLSLGKC